MDIALIIENVLRGYFPIGEYSLISKSKRNIEDLKYNVKKTLYEENHDWS